MSNFNPNQVRALSAKLDRGRVQTRKGLDDRELSYVEGWFVISEANAIFGFSGWDRETVHCERVFERAEGSEITCGYLTRVRIRVRAGRGSVSREGTGFGSGKSRLRAEAHELALKGAETDATKRALATFGNRFGLALYDKDQAGVTPDLAPPRSWTVFGHDGQPFVAALSPEGYCSALRQIIEKVPASELNAWRNHNRDGLCRLRQSLPHLKTPKGTHYADILENLIVRRIQEASPSEAASDAGKVRNRLAPSKIAKGPRIDKSLLALPTERRIRDKAHLKFVASHPCLVCGRQPAHAHHVTYAQARGLSQKVSDEFTVSLCALHHGELHRSGSERSWWAKFRLDPIPVAAEFWTQHNQPESRGAPADPSASHRNRVPKASTGTKPAPSI